MSVASSSRESSSVAHSSVASLFDLTGKHVVVTGAARGIGRSAATWLGRAGASITGIDVLERELNICHGALGGEGIPMHPIVADLSKDSELKEIHEHLGDLPDVDVLVSSAGVVGRHHAADATVEELDALWRINVRGLFSVTQSVLPGMIRNGRGSIIQLGSLGSVLGLENRVAYSMTKGAVAQYTKSLAVDLGPHNIRVNALAPGYVETDMARPWISSDAQRTERLLGRIPLGRFAQTDDLAAALLFLAGPGASYVTGQVVVVDGGWTAW